MKSGSQSYQFGPFEFDPAQQELRNGDDRVTLPPALNKLLVVFVNRPGGLVTREDIANSLWDDHGLVDVENGINGAVRRLRMQLASGPRGSCASDDYIETVVGTGYRFVAPVTLSGRDEAEGVAAARFEGSARPWGRRLAIAGILLGVVGFGVAKWWEAEGGGNRSGGVPAFEWFPVTFDELEDGLAAQALSPGGTLVATSDQEGLVVRAAAVAAKGGATAEARLAGQERLGLPAGVKGDHLAWFPDERHLLVSGSRKDGGKAGIWVISRAGEPAVEVVDDAAQGTVAPDGKRIAYTRAGRAELWVAEADGKRATQLVKAKDGETLNAVMWAPDSQRVVVDREAAGAKRGDAEKTAVDQLQQQRTWTYESYNAQNGKLLARKAGLRFASGYLLGDGRFFYAVAAEGEGLKLAVAATKLSTGAIVGSPEIAALPVLGVRAVDLTGSKDGKSISAVIDRPGVDVFVGDFRAAGPALENVRRLTHHAGTTYPTSWSPDGTELVFDQGDAGRWVIARQKLGSDKIEVMADTGGRAVQGQYTPDGRWILFLHYVGKPTRVESIDRVAATGGKVERVYASHDLEDFHCSRAAMGSCVLRESVGNTELVYYALDAVTGRGVELARTGWVPNVLGDWSLSADGKTVAMANHDPAHPGFSLIELVAGTSGPGHLSGAVTRIPLEGMGTVLCPSWAVDGKAFFIEVHLDGGYGLVWMERASGVAKILMKSPDPIWGVQSRDMARVAYPGRMVLNRNVWVGGLP